MDFLTADHEGSCVHLRTLEKESRPWGPSPTSGGRDSPQLSPEARLQEVATLGPSQAGGRRGSLRDETRVPAQTPTQAARSCAHTATVSGDVPREVRASGTAVRAASSMGEPRRAYLGQPSAATRPAPEEPPRTCQETWTQISDVNRVRTGRAQLRPRPRKQRAGGVVSSKVIFALQLIKNQALLFKIRSPGSLHMGPLGLRTWV